MIKLVAFDWNGTLLSDVTAVVRCENIVLAHFNLKPTTLKKYQSHFSIPIRKYWIAMGIDADLFDKNSDQIHELFFQHYEIEETKCRTRSGSREVLTWLAKKGIKSAIFSNHIIPNIANQLKRLKLEPHVDQILARLSLDDKIHMHERHKEKKLSEYVEKLKLNSDEVIVVGDTDEEIDIGRNLGYITVALTGGHQTEQRLKAAKPNFLIHNLKDLKKIIQQINGRTNQRN